MTEFVAPLRVALDPSSFSSQVTGSLAGLRLAIKDLIDLEGIPTGAGNPTFLARAEPASDSAPALQRLLEQGACPVGKAHTDEFAFSLSGTNAHYGTPINPAAPGRIPGGSSSGSAAAVAAGIADIALGTDTAGSVRVPAAYCGVYGIRPTHGRVPSVGILPLAPSFDTCGLLASDGPRLALAGRVLLQTPPSSEHRPPSSLTLATDLISQADPAVAAAVRERSRAAAAALGIELHEGHLSGTRLADWFEAFRDRQMVEVWRTHGEWLQANRPVLGPGIAARFATAQATPESAWAAADEAELEVLDALDRLLPPGGALVLPAAATVPPPPTLTPELKQDLRLRTMRLTCVAGLTGAPAVSFPTVTADQNLPVGVSVLARPGEDERLLALAELWGPQPHGEVTDACA